MLNQVSITQKKILNGEKVEYSLGKKALKILKKKNKKKILKKRKGAIGREKAGIYKHQIQSTTNKIQQIKIDWANIYFYDGKINFLINKHYSQYFPCAESKRSYNFLKKFFVQKSLNPLLVTFRNLDPISVKNLDELNKVIEILSIEDDCRFAQMNLSISERKDLNKTHLSNTDICRIYNLYNKSVFFDCLIELQDSNLKLVDVPELILNKAFEIVDLHASFLFSYKKNAFFKIIWESVIEKKATYIFTGINSKYEETIQKLNDFISSPLIKNKRETLINNFSLQQQLLMKKRLKHDIPNLWLKEIKEM